MKKKTDLEQGQIVPGKDPTIWRKDQCGALIKWDMYGDRFNQLIVVGR